MAVEDERQVLAGAPIAYLSLGADGLVQDFNLAAAGLTGWDPAEVVGRRLSATMNGTDLPHDTAGEPVEIEITHRDGRRLPIQARVWTTGGDGRVHAFLRDLTGPHAQAAALARAEREARAQRAYLNEILEFLEVFVLTCDAGGNLVHINRAGRGVPGEDTPSRVEQLSRVAPHGEPPRAVNHPLARALRGETLCAEPMVLHLDDGRRRAVMVDAQPMRDADGRPAGAIVAGYDVTALREREAELSGFAAVVAHDLKTPLTGIVGFTELAEEALAEDHCRAAGIAAKFVARVQRNAKAMDQQINGLLAYATARDKPLEAGTIDVVSLVAEIAAIRTGHLAAGQRPLIETRHCEPVVADPDMLRQVLDNLIGNAVKYTPPGERAHVTVSVERRAGRARLTVADRGIGIPADQRDKVLARFHRAHPREGYAGTGLGLAICQRVAQRHGGAIEVGDNPGGGTRITISLPD